MRYTNHFISYCILLTALLVACSLGTGASAGPWEVRSISSCTIHALYSSIAVDSSDFAHISFHGPQDDLRYAWEDASGWHVLSIDGSADWPDPYKSVGDHSSIALDSQQYPHISYCRMEPHYELKYAWKDTDGWHIDVVDSTGEVGKWSSIGVDTYGYPHISYYDETNGDLKYAQKNASGWQVSVVDSVTGRGSIPG